MRFSDTGATPALERGKEEPEGETTLADEQGAKPRPNYLLHIGLFILTFLSVAFSGSQMVVPEKIFVDQGIWAAILHALPFSAMVMFFLTAHEFGHYFAARIHGVDATLPYYIPMPFFFFGTMGAVIRTRSMIRSRKALFDIGVAGPLAGFVVALTYLVIGVATMPGVESLYSFHPTYREMPMLPDWGVNFGSFPLLEIIKQIFLEPGRFFPGPNEMYHYPFLAAGWFGMFVTMLNMIPVGQLDGGHVLYAMVGRRQKAISKWVMRILVLLGLGWVGSLLLDATRTYNSDPVYQFLQTIFGPPMEFLAQHAPWWFQGWPGWLLWAVIIRIFIRVAHPPVPDEQPLGPKRMAIGWIAFAILVLTFTPRGIYELPTPATEQPTAQVKSQK